MGKFDEYLFHCSSLGEIMTDAKSGPGLGETCKGHLLECWIEVTYGRERNFTNKYVQKGLMVEEDSMTLYSRAKKVFYEKNQKTFHNDFIIGTPDIIADEVKDLKSSWDIFTFYRVIGKPINKIYDYQLTGYMDLIGLHTAGLVYCLVDTPEPLIQSEKRKLAWDMGVIETATDPNYIAGCEAIDKACRYGDIPLEKRFIEFKLKHEPAKVEKVYTRVKECREFLNSLS